MKEERKHIDDIFRDKLWDLSISPDPEAWDNISSKLGNNKRRLLPVLGRIAAAILLLIGTGMVTYYLMRDTDNPAINTELSENIQKSDQDNLITPDNEKENFIRESVAGDLTDKELIPQNSDIDEIDQSEGIGTKEAIIDHEQKNDELPMAQIEVSDQSRSKDLLSIQSYITSSGIESELPIRLEPGIYSAEKNDLPPDIEEVFAKSEDLSYRKSSPQNRWAIGGEIAPVFAYREVRSNELGDNLTQYINDNEKGILSYSGGMNVKLNASKRLTVQSGLYYTKLGHTVEQFPVDVPSDDILGVAFPGKIDNVVNQEREVSSSPIASTYTNSVSEQKIYSSDIQPVGTNEAQNFTNNNWNNQVPESVPATHYAEYLEVPLIVKYKMIDRKLDFIMLGGVSTNFLVGDQLQVVRNQYTYSLDEFTNNKKFNYSGSVGLGLEYPLSSNLLINLEPTFKYFFNSVYNNPIMEKHPYAFGLYTGVSYRF